MYVNPEGKVEDFKQGDGVEYVQTWEGAPSPEPGVVTMVSGGRVFVRYHGQFNSLATDPRDLRKVD